MLAYLLEAYQDVNVPTTTGKKKRQVLKSSDFIMGFILVFAFNINN